MPRKTDRGGLRARVCGLASMRPRPDAAENVYQEMNVDPDMVASMRPRPDAAENPFRSARCAPADDGFNEAAARCRGKRRKEKRHAEDEPGLQ